MVLYRRNPWTYVNRKHLTGKRRCDGNQRLKRPHHSGSLTNQRDIQRNRIGGGGSGAHVRRQVPSPRAAATPPTRGARRIGTMITSSEYCDFHRQDKRLSPRGGGGWMATGKGGG